MADFTGKTVIVTGAGSGIGEGIASHFAAAGANVVAVGRDEAKLRAALGDVAPDRLLIHPADVADPATATRVVAAAVERFGALDVLVNNAAAFAVGTIEATADADFDRLIATNIGGYWHLARAAMPELKKTKGAIVMVSSASGRGGDWGMAAYNVTKGAVDNMVRALALDHGRDGVRVNAVNPSLTETPITAGMRKDEGAIAKFMDRIPMGRVGTPADVAKVVAFLASDDAGFVTGVTLPVDGGLSASNGQPRFAS